MRAVIAVNNLGYVGLDGELPWRNLADFKHFKKLTMGAELLVGYNTLQKLPPLKGRTVIEDKRGYFMPVTDSVWCIGGKKTYEKYAHQFSELHISHIDNNNIGDTMFPDLKNLSPDCKIFNYNF